MFDEIWVSGQAHIDRFANMNINMAGTVFKKIGLPQVYDQLLFAEANPWYTRNEEYSVLYMPTWEGMYQHQKYSSIPLATKFLPALSGLGVKKFGVKLHPTTNAKYHQLTKALVASLRANNRDTTFYSSTLKAETLLRSYNIYVCDCSAIMTYCLAMDSPLFVYMPDNNKIIKAFSNHDINEYAYVFSNPDEFITIFQKFCYEGDYL